MEDEDDDDWGLSAEQLDSLERDALQKIAQQQQQQHVAYSSVPSLPSASTLTHLPFTNPNSGTNVRKVGVKLFLHASGNIAAKVPFDQAVVAAVRNIPKAFWSAQERVWMFPPSSLQSAEKCLSEIHRVHVELGKLDPLVQRAMAAASSHPDLRDRYEEMPAHLESKLMPFQRDGVRFVLQHGGRALLADEMGLGKTIQAVAVASCVKESWPVLVLAPSSLRLQWASMIQQWLDIAPSDILVVLSQSSGSYKSGFTIVTSSSKNSVRLDGLFNIISYDIVPKLQDTLMALDFKVVIADESHFLKNAQAKRTVASLPVIKKAQYAILLSGTPALSRPIELFKQLEALCPNVYTNVHEYGSRYCKGGGFGMYQGASNHEELHGLMKTTLMIRRLKKDVLTELPTKRRQQVFLDVSEKDMKQVNALFRELEVIKGKIKDCNSSEEIDALNLSQKNLLTQIYTESAAAKIPAVVDYLTTMIEAGCKFLVFAHHQAMIDAIHQFLVKKKVGCIRIDGNVSAASRQALVMEFQEQGSIKAAVLSIKAGGVGLTLTAASTVVFAELGWTPGELIQAEDRAHRIGQVSSVNVYYLLANHTVDDIIWDVVQSKLEKLGQVLDGEEKRLEVKSSSPKKQTNLDSFVKRCNDNNTDQANKQPRRF